MRALKLSRIACRLAGSAFALLGACSPIRYSAEEVLLRPDAQADTIDVLILYSGIQFEPQGQSGDPNDATRRFVEHVTRGRREFMLFDWPFHVDLDDPDELRPDAKKDDGPWDAWWRRWIEVLAGVEVVGSGHFVDDEGRPALHQHLRVGKASALVELLDGALHLGIDELEAEGELSKVPWLDDATRRALIQLARDKQRWLAIRDGGIEANLPVTSRSAARILEALLDACAKDEDLAGSYACLLGGLDTLELSEDRVRLRWASGGGVVRFRKESPGGYDAGLADELRERKALPTPMPTRADVVKAFRGT